MYSNSLLRKKLYEWESDTSRKIRTYVKNDSFYRNDLFAICREKRNRKKMGLTPLIYNGISSIGKHDYDWFGYSADPFRDSVKAMADRIILW